MIERTEKVFPCSRGSQPLEEGGGHIFEVGESAIWVWVLGGEKGRSRELRD
jgi:hypothetical protein